MMFIELAYVQSLDGFITKGDEPPHLWKSAADESHFLNLKKQYPLIIFGSGTFDQIQSNLRIDDEILRMVATSRFDDYSAFAQSGKLEFSNLPPQKLVTSLEERGYSRALLLSGGKLSTSFLKAGLVDQLTITIEPRLFGEGQRMVLSPSDYHFKLISNERFGDSDTILVRYKKGELNDS